MPQPCGNVHPVIAPYGTFETSDGPINLAPATQDMWVRLCSVLNLDELVADPRFVRNADRMKNRHALKDILEGALKQHPRMHWTPIMIEQGIPAGPINTLEDVFRDEQVLACNLVQTVEHARLGQLRQVALPVHMSNHDSNSVVSSPPVFGRDTLRVATDMGMNSDQIEQLIADGVLYQADRQN